MIASGIPTTPTLITDQDALTLIALDDTIAAQVEGAWSSLANPPAGPFAAWRADLATYTAWATDAKAQLEGGFFFGAWFGVPDLYNQAAAWAVRLETHGADATAAGAQVGGFPVTPAPRGPTVNDFPWAALFTAVTAVAVTGGAVYALSELGVLRKIIKAL